MNLALKEGPPRGVYTGNPIALEAWELFANLRRMNVIAVNRPRYFSGSEILAGYSISPEAAAFQGQVLRMDMEQRLKLPIIYRMGDQAAVRVENDYGFGKHGDPEVQINWVEEANSAVSEDAQQIIPNFSSAGRRAYYRLNLVYSGPVGDLEPEGIKAELKVNLASPADIEWSRGIEGAGFQQEERFISRGNKSGRRPSRIMFKKISFVGEEKAALSGNESDPLLFEYLIKDSELLAKIKEINGDFEVSGFSVPKASRSVRSLFKNAAAAVGGILLEELTGGPF